MRYSNRKRFTMRQVVGLLTFVFLGITVIAYAAVTVPNTFSSGTTISSSQVNANFTALGNAMPAVKSIATFYDTALPNSGTVVNIATLSVTPPVAGYIILTGSTHVGVDKATADRNEANVYLTTISATTSSNFTTLINCCDTSGYKWVPLSITAVYPVTGGVLQNFYLTAKRDTTTNNVYVGHSLFGGVRLIAQFVPGTALP